MFKVSLLGSGHFFSIAREACERSLNTADEAIVAVVFSALAVEAFLNDMVHLTEAVGDSAGTGSRVDEGEKFKVFGSIMRQLEDQRAPVTMKMQMAHYIFTGTHLDRGSQPYQDYALLIERLTLDDNGAIHNVPCDDLHGVILPKPTLLFQGAELLRE